MLLLTAALTIPLGLSVAMPFWSASDVRAGRPILVVAAPWNGGAARIVRAAGGRLVGPAAARLAVLAVFDDLVPADTLRDLGSWAIADGTLIANICGVTLDA